MENAAYDTDEELMHCFRMGDPPAFTLLYKRFYKRVLYFSRRYVPDADAQDITAEAFIQLWNKRSAIEDTRGLAAFLFVTARNRCYNLLRDEQTKRNHEPNLIGLLDVNGPNPLELEQVRLELVGLLQKEINKLPEKMREVFILSFREGLKPAQIAERLGISVKTVKNQKVSAIKLLRHAVAQHPLELVLLALLHHSLFYFPNA